MKSRKQEKFTVQDCFLIARKWSEKPEKQNGKIKGDIFVKEKFAIQKLSTV